MEKDPSELTDDELIDRLRSDVREVHAAIVADETVPSDLDPTEYEDPDEDK